MKEVFDRLRKRMEESSFPTTDNYVAVWYDDAISNINEEEKKWEKECSNGDLVSKRALLEEWDRQSSRGHYEFDQTIMTFPSYKKDEEVKVKDSECRAYLHTYKCDKESCKGCEYRYYADNSANKAIDEFASRMISMMPGHRQDIMKIAETMKETN